MSIRPIHLLGSPVLRQKSEDVETIDESVRELIKDLTDTMYADDGLGLAANQIGVAMQIAVVGHETGPPLVLINPRLVQQEGAAKEEEGCLSLPELFAEVPRPANIVVDTLDLEGNTVRLEAEGIEARAILHEMDHLNGILFIDHLSPLKRQLLLKKWKKLRKGKEGYLKHLTPAAAGR